MVKGIAAFVKILFHHPGCIFRNGKTQTYSEKWCHQAKG